MTTFVPPSGLGKGKGKGKIVDSVVVSKQNLSTENVNGMCIRAVTASHFLFYYAVSTFAQF